MPQEKSIDDYDYTGMQPHMPIDYLELKREIVAAAKRIFAEMNAQRAGETFLAFGFDVDSDVVTIAAFAVTRQDLQRKVEKSGDERFKDFFWWAIQEWPLWNAFPTHLGKAAKIVNRYVWEDPAEHSDQIFILRKRNLLNILADSLKELDEAGVFAAASKREDFLLYLDNGDPGLEDAVMYLELARKINPPRIMERYEKHVRTMLELNGATLEVMMKDLRDQGLLDTV